MKCIVQHLVRLYRNFRAWRAGRMVYIVPDLHRMCWAISEKQCHAKFCGHHVARPSLLMRMRFVLFGYLSGDQAQLRTK